MALLARAAARRVKRPSRAARDLACFPDISGQGPKSRLQIGNRYLFADFCEMLNGNFNIFRKFVWERFYFNIRLCLE